MHFKAEAKFLGGHRAPHPVFATLLLTGASVAAVATSSYMPPLSKSARVSFAARPLQTQEAMPDVELLPYRAVSPKRAERVATDPMAFPSSGIETAGETPTARLAPPVAPSTLVTFARPSPVVRPGSATSPAATAGLQESSVRAEADAVAAVPAPTIGLAEPSNAAPIHSQAPTGTIASVALAGSLPAAAPLNFGSSTADGPETAVSSPLPILGGQVPAEPGAELVAVAVPRPQATGATGIQPSALLDRIPAPLPIARSDPKVFPSSTLNHLPEAQPDRADAVAPRSIRSADKVGELGSAAKIQLPAKPTPSAAAASISQFKQTGNGIEFEVGARIGRVSAGRIPLLIAGANANRPRNVSHDISVRLSDVINLLGPKMEPGLFTKLSSSEHATQYVTLNDLRSYGIAVSFDEHDRLVFQAH